MFPSIASSQNLLDVFAEIFSRGYVALA